MAGPAKGALRGLPNEEIWNYHVPVWPRHERALAQFMISDEPASIMRMAHRCLPSSGEIDQIIIRVDDRSTSMKSKASAIVRAESDLLNALLATRKPESLLWQCHVNDQVRLLHPRRGAVRLEEMALPQLQDFKIGQGLISGSCISDGYRFAAALACSHASRGIAIPIKIAVTTDGENMHPSVDSNYALAMEWRDRSERRAARWIETARRFGNIHFAHFGFVREKDGSWEAHDRFRRSMGIRPEEDHLIFVKPGDSFDRSVGVTSRLTSDFISY
ncbi:MAG: hypothetical protein DCC75_07770 [Proteobacteria bacterium]|nr:MAG: hypothetical protein DCC75_07770 [Pseudomonadota bacterium]